MVCLQPTREFHVRPDRHSSLNRQAHSLHFHSPEQPHTGQATRLLVAGHLSLEHPSPARLQVLTIQADKRVGQQRLLLSHPRTYERRWGGDCFMVWIKAMCTRDGLEEFLGRSEPGQHLHLHSWSVWLVSKFLQFKLYLYVPDAELQPWNAALWTALWSFARRVKLSPQQFSGRARPM